MKTYGDILRHHIRNKELLALIEHYNKTFPDDCGDGWCGDMFSREVDDAFIESDDLWAMISDSFIHSKTREGSFYWHCLINFIPLDIENFYIDDWKHIDEWFDDKTPQLLLANKEKYTDYVILRGSDFDTQIKGKELCFFSLAHLFDFILHCFANGDEFKLCEKEKELIGFVVEYNRFPNSFDS